MHGSGKMSGLCSVVPHQRIGSGRFPEGIFSVDVVYLGLVAKSLNYHMRQTFNCVFQVILVKSH